MRLTQKKIEEIIVGVLSDDGLPLVKQLYSKSNVSEFDLATRTKKDIKVIRKQLYILYNNNLVAFTRKKDKLKGWYVYYWTLVPESVRYYYLKKKKEWLATLQQQLGEEKKELFFACVKRCVRLNFDQATEFEFHCPECGDLVLQDDQKPRISALQKQILGINQEILEGAKKNRKEIIKKEKPKKKRVKKK